MAWRDGEMFKLRKRDGRCWQVCWRWDRRRWLSTHEYEHDAALEWAERHVALSGRAPTGSSMLFGAFAKGFFSIADPCGHRRRRTLLGHAMDDDSYALRERYLEDYVMPFFHDVPLREINAVMIEDWYINLVGKRDGQPLSGWTKLTALQSMKAVMKECARLGLVDYDPCERVGRINPSCNEKPVFSADLLCRMFPPCIDDVIALWGGVQEALFFSIAADTGWRAGEVLALSVDDYHEDCKGLFSTEQVSTATMRLKGRVKTASSGYAFRIGFLSERSIALIARLPENKRTGRFFEKEAGSGIFLCYGYLLRHLKAVLRNLGCPDWERYGTHSFRHTFMTRIKSKVPEWQLLMLMGHTHYRKEYDHSSPIQRFEELDGIRDKVVLF